MQRRETSDIFSPGDILTGRYLYLQCIGRGGMGEVGLVEDLATKRKLAMKYCLSKRHSPRFAQEIHSWFELGQHPHIVSALHLEKIMGAPALFLEYVSGHNLRALIKETGDKGLPLKTVLDFSIQICAGMEHLHSQGVIHRDLNPNNIMVEESNSSHKIKITDLGLSKIKSRPDESGSPDQNIEGFADNDFPTPELTQTHEMIGTLQYMSPQQYACSKSVGESTDIYAFGVVVYEMLSRGKKPFSVESPQGWLYAHAFETPKHIKKQASAGFALFLKRKQRELYDLIMQCLAKKNEERPASFRQIGERLREIYQELYKEDYPSKKVSTIILEDSYAHNKAVSLFSLNAEYSSKAKETFQHLCQKGTRFDLAWLNHSLLQIRGHEKTLVRFWYESPQEPSLDFREALAGVTLEKRLSNTKPQEILSSDFSSPFLQRILAGWFYLSGNYFESEKIYQSICATPSARSEDFYHWIGTIVLAARKKGTIQVILEEKNLCFVAEPSWRKEVPIAVIIEEAKKRKDNPELIEEAEEVWETRKKKRTSFWFPKCKIPTPRKIRQISLSPSGQKVSWITGEGMSTWEISPSKPLQKMAKKHLTALAWNSDDETFALGTEQGKIEIYNSDKLVFSKKSHNDGTIVLKFLKNERNDLLSAGGNTIKIWNWQKKSKVWPFSLRQTLKIPRQEKITTCTSCAQGKIIAAGAESGRIWVWARKKRKKHHFLVQIKPYDSPVTQIALFQHWLIAQADNEKLLVWDIKENTKRWYNHSNIRTFALSQDGQELLLATGKGLVVESLLSPSPELLTDTDTTITQMMVSDNGCAGISLSEGDEIWYWENEYLWPLRFEQRLFMTMDE